MLTFLLCIGLFWMRSVNSIPSPPYNYHFEFGRCGISVGKKCVQSVQITVGTQSHLVIKMDEKLHKKGKKQKETPTALYLYTCNNPVDEPWTKYWWIDGGATKAGDGVPDFVFLDAKTNTKLRMGRTALSKRISDGHVKFNSNKLHRPCTFFSVDQPPRSISFDKSDSGAGIAITGMDPIQAGCPNPSIAPQLVIEPGCCMDIRTDKDDTFKTYVVTQRGSSLLTLEEFNPDSTKNGASLSWDKAQFMEQCAKDHVKTEFGLLHIQEESGRCEPIRLPDDNTVLDEFDMQTRVYAGRNELKMVGFRIYNGKDKPYAATLRIGGICKNKIYINIFNPAHGREEWIPFKYNNWKVESGIGYTYLFSSGSKVIEFHHRHEYPPHMKQFERLISVAKVSLDADGTRLIVADDFDVSYYKKVKKDCHLTEDKSAGVAAMTIDGAPGGGIMIKGIKTASGAAKVRVGPKYCPLWVRGSSREWTPWYMTTDKSAVRAHILANRGTIGGKIIWASADLRDKNVMRTLEMNPNTILESYCFFGGCALTPGEGFKDMFAARVDAYSDYYEMDDLAREEESVYVEEEKDLLRLLRRVKQLRKH
eukprot:150217_1